MLSRIVIAVVALACCAPAAAQRWPSVATDLPKAGGGENDVAVVVGVSDYFALPDIAGAADNARDWSQYLLRVRGLRRDRLTLLTDGEATKERIERALTAAATSSSSTGRLWFIFVGHGAPSPRGTDGVLLGADTQADADSLAARGLSQARVDEILKTGAYNDAVIVYDACFSGSTSDGGAPLVRGMQATIPVRQAPAKQPAKVTVLSSSESFAGPLPGEQRPAFSYLLLGGARGWADDDNNGAVTIDEAYGFASDTLRAALKQSSRLPVRRGATTTAALSVKAKEPAPDIDALLLGRCPEGTRWNNRSCAVIDCPKGTSFDGTGCAPPPMTASCPTGSVWNGKNCAATTVSCPAGTEWSGTDCRARVLVRAAPRMEPPTPRTLAEMEAVGGIAVVGENLVLAVNSFFDPGEVTLRPETVPMFQTLAQGFATVDEIESASIVCHSDAAGTPQDAHRMTAARAQAIVDVLVRSGIERQRLRAFGAGYDQPIADNRTDAGRAANRRCVVLFTTE